MRLTRDDLVIAAEFGHVKAVLEGNGKRLETLRGTAVKANGRLRE
jgi:hypothetical protein